LKKLNNNGFRFGEIIGGKKENSRPKYLLFFDQVVISSKVRVSPTSSWNILKQAFKVKYNGFRFGDSFLIQLLFLQKLEYLRPRLGIFLKQAFKVKYNGFRFGVF